MNDKIKSKIDLANVELSYSAFRELAKNKSLSKYERIGFPDSYRDGFEYYIFEDICAKLTNINGKNKNILDIGPGCSDLPKLLINLSKNNGHKLVFCDSHEMLSFYNDDFLLKVPGMFPDVYEDIHRVQKEYDAIICYSVFHYIFHDTNMWKFIDCCFSLLKPGGQFLLGDIPNISKRKRFFASKSGIDFHKEFTKSDSDPIVNFNKIEEGKIDDSILLSIVMRAQYFGFNAYILPQKNNLPMSNRRDDILILRP